LETTCRAGWRRPSRSASALAIAALVAALLGCDRSGSGGAPKKQRFDSNGGRFSVELETAPAAIEVNQPFDVTLAVAPKNGPATDLEVLVDARMPAHFHGMNRVAKVSRGSGNTWKAEGLVFHMPGHWELYVDITQGGVTERAQMDVDLK
jgi:hypothetical protein